MGQACQSWALVQFVDKETYRRALTAKIVCSIHAPYQAADIDDRYIRVVVPLILVEFELWANVQYSVCPTLGQDVSTETSMLSVHDAITCVYFIITLGHIGAGANCGCLPCASGWWLSSVLIADC